MHAPLIAALVTLSTAPTAPPTQAEELEKLGTYSHEVGGLADPSAVLVNDDGTTLALEWALDRIVVLAPDGERTAVLGGPGAGPGQLRGARDMALGPEGLLWIADTGNHRVQVWTIHGEFVRAFGAFGSASGELNAPHGIAVDGERVVVADTLNDRVQVFDREGHSLLRFGGWGADDALFNHPMDVTLDDAGNVYVADADNHRVQKFDAEGAHLLSFGDFGPHPGFFAAPSGVTHHGGLIYVNDRENHRIQVFDLEGEHVYTWGLHALLPRESAGKLHYPRQVAISPSGRLAAIAEDQENRIQYFGPTPAGTAPPAVDALSRSNAAHFGARVAAAGGIMILLEPTRPAFRFYDVATDVGGDEPIEISKTGAWGRGFGQLLRPSDAALDVERSWIHLADPANLKLETWRYDRKEGPIGYDPYMLKLAFSRNLREMQASAAGVIEPIALERHPAGHLVVVDARSRAVVQVGAPEPAGAAARVQVTPVWFRPFAEPVDLAFSPAGTTLYVVDRLGPGVYWTELEVAGDALGLGERQGELRPPAGTPFARPNGIAVAPDGRIYVSDAHRSQLLVFGPDGTFRSTLGREGLGSVEFYKPAGIALRNADELVVMDHGNHRSLILTLDGEYVHAFGARLFTRPIRQELAERARIEAGLPAGDPPEGEADG